MYAKDLMPQSISYTLEAERVINDLETLKVVADPLRLRLLYLLEEPHTVKQLAEELKLAPTKLYYHVKLLEEHGLIRVMDTQIVSGIIEKHYQVAALNFRVSKALLAPTSAGGNEGLNLALSSVLEEVHSAILQGARSGAIIMADDAPRHHQLRLSRAVARMTPQQAEAFYGRLDQLLKDFGQTSPDAPGEETQWYSLLVALHPMADGQGNDKEGAP